MNLEFIGQNVHFAVNLLASLAFFALFWLTFDAWYERKKPLEGIKWAGFLAVALGLLINAAIVEQDEFVHTGLSAHLPGISIALRIAGYVLLLASQLFDPIMKRPVYKADAIEQAPVREPVQEPSQDSESDAITVKRHPKKIMGVVTTGKVASSAVIQLVALPLLPLSIAALYYRRATTGLERHLRPVAYGFLAMALFELFAAIGAWHVTTNPLAYDWVSIYGRVWWLAQGSLLLAGIIFGTWVWRYLTKRLLSQLFIVLVTASVAIFFVSTAGFSLLLLRSTRAQAIDNLSVSSKVLGYAVDSRKSELKAQAEAAIAKPDIIAAAEASDHTAMLAAVGSFAVNHKLSAITVTDADGKVLLRSDDPTRYGDSLSDNSLVVRALIGREASSTVVTPGVVAPYVALVSSLPIKSADGLIVGSVTTTKSVSNAFVDGIKVSTGLDSTVYGGSARSATTLKATGSNRRAVGIKETNKTVLTKVLKQSQNYSGETSYQNRDYLSAYTPLKNVDNETVGMVLVAQPASTLLANAAKSIQQAFIVTVILLIVSIIPVYLIAKKIANGVR